MMTHQEILDFIHKQTKLGLDHIQRFDQGGNVLNGPSVAGNTGTNQSPGSQGIAGALGNFLGTNNNSQAQGAVTQEGTNGGQLNQAYQGAQGALGQANNLTNQLAPGVSQGAQTQNTLTGQLQNEALGQGPNPAQNALNQATGQNIAQSAAVAAGTRGAGANAGMIAQNAAMQGANANQQAAGQSATLQAQQQLAAQNSLQGLAAQQVGQASNAVQLGNQTQQNEQNILQGANTAANNNAVSMQGNINSTNAAIAQGNSNSNQNILGGIGGALGGIGGAIIGGPAGALVGSKVGSLFAEGGSVHPDLHALAKIYYPEHFAGGGAASYQMASPTTNNVNMGTPLAMPGYSKRQGIQYSPEEMDLINQPAQAAPGTNPTGVGGGYGLGGQGMVNELGAQNPYGAPPPTSDSFQMPSMGSQGASSSPNLGPFGAKGGKVGAKLKKGGDVPGKPKVDHDAYKNDTVDAKLSPGEFVIPIDVMKDKGKLGKMARFVAQNIERKKMGRAL